jgi:hypothetical protein
MEVNKIRYSRASGDDRFPDYFNNIKHCSKERNIGADMVKEGIKDTVKEVISTADLQFTTILYFISCGSSNDCFEPQDNCSQLESGHKKIQMSRNFSEGIPFFPATRPEVLCISR